MSREERRVHVLSSELEGSRFQFDYLRIDHIFAKKSILIFFRESIFFPAESMLVKLKSNPQDENKGLIGSYTYVLCKTLRPAPNVPLNTSIPFCTLDSIL